MSERIWGITLFVDHATDWTYEHLMQSLELSETLLAKQAIKKIAACKGHSIQQYHANNGGYADNGILASINSNDQTITFCGVGAHHQNSIVKGSICIVTETARTLLLQAQCHCPKCIDTML